MEINTSVCFSNLYQRTQGLTLWSTKKQWMTIQNKFSNNFSLLPTNLKGVQRSRDVLIRAHPWVLKKLQKSNDRKWFSQNGLNVKIVLYVFITVKSRSREALCYFKNCKANTRRTQYAWCTYLTIPNLRNQTDIRSPREF